MSNRSMVIDGVAIMALFVMGFAQAQEQPAAPISAPLKAQAAQDDRAADRDSIRATVKSLVEAFEKGDAEKTASFLTDEAELISEDSPPIRGKKAILDALKANFEKNQKQRMIVEMDSLRFLSKDTAIEEGHLKSSVHQQAWTSQRYSMMHVRENGKWLIAMLKEWPSEEAPLRDLEWLIGSWQAQRDDLAINTTYEWIGNKAFIRGNINTRQKDRTVSAMQVIGLDPATGALRIWIFEANGIYAEGTCHRDKNSWIFETSGASPDGTPVSAKNILLHVNPDVMTWQPVQLRMGQEQIADLPPIKVTRTKK